MKKYYLALTKKSGGHVTVPLNTKSLEETDNYIANNFSNYKELSGYIISHSKNKKTCNPYPFIKQVVKTSKGQETTSFSPTYAKLDKIKILELSKDILMHMDEYIYNRDEIRKISKTLSKEKIEYQDIRECYFALLRLDIPKRDLIFDNGIQTEIKSKSIRR